MYHKICHKWDKDIRKCLHFVLAKCQVGNIYIVQEIQSFFPAWWLVCPLPAVQELQPVLLQRIHQGAGQGPEAQAEGDKEDFKGQLQWWAGRSITPYSLYRCRCSWAEPSTDSKGGIQPHDGEHHQPAEDNKARRKCLLHKFPFLRTGVQVFLLDGSSWSEFSAGHFQPPCCCSLIWGQGNLWRWEWWRGGEW